MQLSVYCDVILEPKEMKFLQLGRLRAGFHLSKNSSVNDVIINDNLFDDSPPGEVIRRARFDVCTPSSF